MSELTPQLIIERDDTPSVNDLVLEKNRGVSVIRTPHVGNMAPYNLTIADSGIPMVVVDHNITGVDKNYRPESIINQTAEQPIASVGQLTLRAVAGSMPEQVLAMVNGGRFLDEVHLSAIRTILPNARLVSNTEYFRQNSAIAEEIVGIVLASKPEIFDRKICSDGSISDRQPFADQVTSKGLMQLNDDPRTGEAILAPLEVDILVGFLAEAIKTELDRQYHLSGPDMVRYIVGKIPLLQELYAEIKARASFGSKLPDELNVRLVPSADAKFATTLKRKDALDELISTQAEVVKELADVDGWVTDNRPVDPARTAKFDSRTQSRKDAINRALIEKIAVIPELFVKSGDRGSLTQYDLVEEGGLYVAPINRELPMFALAATYAHLSEVRKRFRKDLLP